MRIVSSFINRNPRNLEFLRLVRRPTGYQFEKSGNKEHFYYKAVLNANKNFTEGFIIHHENGVLIKASTNEPTIASQLYSNVDVSAASVIGRVLAIRSLESGINRCILDADDETMGKSQKWSAFFEALKGSGIIFQELPPIEHTFLNDPNFSWQHFPQHHDRQTKLDELDLKIEYK